MLISKLGPNRSILTSPCHSWYNIIDIGQMCLMEIQLFCANSCNKYRLCTWKWTELVYKPTDMVLKVMLKALEGATQNAFLSVSEVGSISMNSTIRTKLELHPMVHQCVDILWLFHHFKEMQVYCYSFPGLQIS